MTFNQYQMAALKTAIYPDQMLVEYPCLGLCGESGEVADKIKKLARDHNWYPGQTIPDEQRKAIALELGDVMWYIAVLLDRLGWPISDAFNAFDQTMDIGINERVPYILSYFNRHSSITELSLDEMAVMLCALSSRYAFITMSHTTNTHGKAPAIYIVALIAMIGNEIGYSLEEICQMNIDKLADRQKRNTLHGSGDNR